MNRVTEERAQHDIESLNKSRMASLPLSTEESQNWPQYLRELLTPALLVKSSGLARSRGPTAYLDGLRGWAAFEVYISHHMLGSHMQLPLELGYAHEKNYYFVATPFLRPFFSGSHQAVHIFFIISGYVLSRGFISMIHRGVGTEKIASSLASAVCRRFVRLWTPVLVTTFVTMTIMYMIGHRGPETCSNYIAEVWFYLCNFNTLIVPLSHINWLLYNPHTWTIPYEFRGSMYVFLAMLATHKMRKKVRMLLLLFLAMWVHSNGSWGCSTFLFGIVLAEFDLLEESDMPQWAWWKSVRYHKRKLFLVVIIFALHTAGQPMKAFGSLDPVTYYLTYGYGWMGLRIPLAYAHALNDFWYTFGALGMITAVTNIEFLRKLFETRFSQYLGRISFGFYLVHGPILFIVGERLYAATGVVPSASHTAWNNIWEFGKFGPAGLEVNFLCCHIILLPLTFYFAELCTKIVDGPSVTLARYMYQYTLAESPGD